MNLSFTKISTYEECGSKFKYRYINGFYPKKDSAGLVFGRIVHKVFERLFLNGEHPVQVFEKLWTEQKDKDLDYGKRDTWEKLMDSGIGLMELFLKEEKQRFLETYQVEDFLRFEVDPVTTFWGRGDWIGRAELPEQGRVNVIVDFKTSGQKYNESEAHLSDQLTAYYKAAHKYRFEIDRVAIMALIKTKSPKIQWIVGERTQKEVDEYMAKVTHYNEQIYNGIFLRRTGVHCNWCDYMPLCLGDVEKAREELYVKVQDDEFPLDVLELGELHHISSCPDDEQPKEWLERLIKSCSIEGHFYFCISKEKRAYFYELDGTDLRRVYYGRGGMNGQGSA